MFDCDTANNTLLTRVSMRPVFSIARMVLSNVGGSALIGDLLHLAELHAHAFFEAGLEIVVLDLGEVRRLEGQRAFLRERIRARGCAAAAVSGFGDSVLCCGDEQAASETDKATISERTRIMDELPGRANARVSSQPPYGIQCRWLVFRWAKCKAPHEAGLWCAIYLCDFAGFRPRSINNGSTLGSRPRNARYITSRSSV